ncbi:MAG TPA: thymidine phosphorylase [Pirellulaceae bacterium]
MNPARIIARKRDGLTLDDGEIEYFLRGFTDESIPAYQMSALAMAILLRGMDLRETATLTRVMLESGTVLKWSASDRLPGDKHSTGGLGDKVSLVLAPLLAVAGINVPMISGRGLGPTGGTLDKLEAIPGFRADLTLDEFRRVVDRVGCVISGATRELAPADKKLYALRDVTGTVPSIPLITASILSKKLAAGLQGLVLDVKWGTGAFMKTLPEARALAESLVRVGTSMGLRISACLSDMNQPLGRMVGHTLEVDESLDVLQGRGPADVTELTLELGAELLRLLQLTETRPRGVEVLRRHIDSGEAYAKFREMVQAQGGDLSSSRPRAPESVVSSLSAGYVARVDAEQLGQLVIELGGGRRAAGDTIDPSVGFEMLVRLGDRIGRGDPLARLFAHRAGWETATEMFRAAIEISEMPLAPPPLVVDLVSPE